VSEPRRIDLTHDWAHSGVSVEYLKGRRTLRIGGWYDGCVGIESQEVTLGSFLRDLNITETDVRRALTATPEAT